MSLNKYYILSIIFSCYCLLGKASTDLTIPQFQTILEKVKVDEKKSDSIAGTQTAIKKLEATMENGIETFPEMQADFFLALQHMYLKIGDKYQRDFYLEKARVILEQPEFKKSLWKYHLEKGNALIDIRNYDEAKKYYSLAIEGLSETEHKKELLKTIISLATSLKIQKSDDSSILLYKKAVQLADKYGFEEESLISKSRLGNLLYKNNKISASYFNDIYEHTKKNGDEKKHLYSCIEMAKLYLVLGQHKKAIEFYDEGISIAIELDMKNELRKLNLLKAEQLIALERYDAASDLIEKTDLSSNQYFNCYKKLLNGKVNWGKGRKDFAISSFRFVTNNCSEVMNDNISYKNLNTVYFGIANYLFQSGKLNAALDTVNLATNLEKMDLKTLVNCYDIKSKIYEQKGNYQHSLAALKQKNILLDSLLGLNRIGTYLTEQANLEVAKKESEINNLESQKTIMQIDARRKRNVIYGLLFGLLGLGIGSWFYSRHRKVELEKDLAEVKQNLLRIQINPHFIFNALNSIQSSLLLDDQEKTLHLFNKFSNLMRQILENSANSFIPLNEELELLINYMELEKVRSNNKFDYEVEIEEGIDIYNEEIPSMVLQIFVENSIWHGVIPKEERGLIKLSVGKENGNIKVSVADNGVGRTFSLKHKSKDQQNKKSMGTILVAQRIDLLNRKFGKKLQLDILDGKIEGTVVELLM